MKLPGYIPNFLYESGNLFRFSMRFFKELASRRFESGEFLQQCYLIGNKSLPLIGITGFIIGLVLTLQLRPNMVRYGAESELPAMVGIAIVREIGPMLTALIFAGKIGSNIGAELGSMNVTEQIDAMEVSGTNPFRYLVVSRTLAATLMLPVLTLLSDGIGLCGAYLGVNVHTSMSFRLFFMEVMDNLAMYDIFPAVIKTFFFGFTVGIVGCYKGYQAEKGTESVGKAANSSVVVSSLLVFVIDLVVVQFADLFNIL